MRENVLANEEAENLTVDNNSKELDIYSGRFL